MTACASFCGSMANLPFHCDVHSSGASAWCSWRCISLVCLRLLASRLARLWVATGTPLRASNLFSSHRSPFWPAPCASAATDAVCCSDIVFVGLQGFSNPNANGALSVQLAFGVLRKFVVHSFKWLYNFTFVFATFESFIWGFPICLHQESGQLPWLNGVQATGMKHWKLSA